ncbi:hypothetical protein SNEBB_006425 [Seison nebaliae]|nr:hypothetical protein SNEBB_006425 [Seison nebaliae]
MAKPIESDDDAFDDIGPPPSWSSGASFSWDGVRTPPSVSDSPPRGNGVRTPSVSDSPSKVLVLILGHQLDLLVVPPLMLYCLVIPIILI